MYHAVAVAFVVYIVIGLVLAVVHDIMQRGFTVKRRLIAFVIITFQWLPIAIVFVGIWLYEALIVHLVDKFAREASR